MRKGVYEIEETFQWWGRKKEVNDPLRTQGPEVGKILFISIKK